MRKLHYASGYLLLADQTCKALLRYARALAQTEESDVVMLPRSPKEEVSGTRTY